MGAGREAAWQTGRRGSPRPNAEEGPPRLSSPGAAKEGGTPGRAWEPGPSLAQQRRLHPPTPFL